jgi:DNA-binding CsgD family transcriptional regulator
MDTLVRSKIAIDVRMVRRPDQRQAEGHDRFRGRLHSGAVDAVLAAAGRTSARGAWPAGLTDREVDVLRLIAAATSTREIASRLGITEKTVRNHIDHVFAKTGTSNRVGLSFFALTNGLAAATSTPV